MLRQGKRLDNEIALAAFSGALGLVTLLWADWLEATGWEPDHRGGAVEWMIAAGFLLGAIVLGLGASAKSARPSEDAKPTNRWL